MASGVSVSNLPVNRFYLNPRAFEKIITDMPKPELHTHIEGDVRCDTMLDEADQEHLPRPAPDVASLQKIIGMQPGQNLLDFLKKFDCFRYVFDTKSSLERIAYETIRDNAQEGIVYTELRMDPLKHPDKGVSVGDTIDAICRGMHQACDDYGVDARFITSINRSYPVASAMEVAKAGVARESEGVVGLDLAADEVHYPAKLFKDVFAYAKANGLHATLHAGEAVGPESIRQAIEDCGAERIGHGVRLHEDPALEQEVKARGITLELAPTSNLELNVVKTLKDYPLAHYLRSGIKVSLNTDDKHILQTTLPHEYMEMARQADMSLGELEQVAIEGAQASFADDETKARVLNRIQTGIAQVNAQLAKDHPGATPENTWLSPDDQDHWSHTALS